MPRGVNVNSGSSSSKDSSSASRSAPVIFAVFCGARKVITDSIRPMPGISNEICGRTFGGVQCANARYGVRRRNMACHGRVK